MLYAQEVLVAYNVSDQARNERVIVDATLHPEPSRLNILYGGAGVVPVQTAPSGARFVQLNLGPHHFIILS
jgi:hypothetical protein